MRNEATLWLAKYMEDHGISTEKISRELHIPKKKLIPGTKRKSGRRRIFSTLFLSSN